MGIGALQLMFGVGEKGFQIIVCSWNAIDKVFEDEIESRLSP